MVREFEDIARRLEEQGYPNGAKVTRDMKNVMFLSNLIPENLDKKQDIFHHFLFDYQVSLRQITTKERGKVRLTRLEGSVMFSLFQSINTIIPTEEIIRAGWGETYINSGHDLVKGHIYNLRRKLKSVEVNPNAIGTVFEQGFILYDDDVGNLPTQERKVPPKEKEMYRHRSFTFFPEKSELIVNGSSYILSAKKRKLLDILSKNENSIVPYDTILDYMWGDPDQGDTNLLKVHMSQLRKILDPHKEQKVDDILKVFKNYGIMLRNPDRSGIEMQSETVQ